MMNRDSTFWRAEPKGTSSMTTRCVIIVHQVSSNDAYPSRKVRCYSSTSMKEYVDTTLRQEAWSVKPSDKAFTGRWSSTMWFKL
jgi:hypothetical protein